MRAYHAGYELRRTGERRSRYRPDAVIDPGGDLYGRVLEVRFLDRVREEKKFDSADALVEQIRRDVEFVRNR